VSRMLQFAEIGKIPSETGFGFESLGVFVA
jgi:hypothetical protein